MHINNQKYAGMFLKIVPRLEKSNIKYSMKISGLYHLITVKVTVI